MPINSIIKLQTPNFTAEEIQVIYKMAEVCYVTRAFSKEFKSVRYAVFYAKPPQEIANLFNIGGEILVLLLSEGFEHKTIDYVDFLMGEYKSRLDKRIFLVVSHEVNINEIVEEVKKKNHEDRIIISFNYAEILHNNTSSSNIWDIIKRYNDTDLFNYSSPLSNDAYFFGREEQVKKLYTKYKNGDNSGLFGLRRIGKTSVLYALLRMLKYNKEYGKYFDLEDSAFQKKRWFEVLEFIIKQITHDLIDDEIYASCHKNYSEKNASEFFIEDLRNIYKLTGEKRLLLVFDEIDKITYDSSPEEHWKTGLDFIYLWRTLRAAKQSYPYLFSYLIAGTNPKIVEVSKIGSFENPIYRGISIDYLPFFDENQIQEMVTAIGKLMLLNFDRSIFTHLKTDYGGHPFLIRLVCSMLNMKRSPIHSDFHVKDGLYRVNKNNFDVGLKDYIYTILEVLIKDYPDEYDLLTLLALDKYNEFKEKMNTTMHSIQHLKGYNLVDYADENYFITLEVIKKYLKETANLPVDAAKLSVEEKWEILVTRRGNVENKLRNLVKSKLIFLSSKEALAKIINFVRKNNNRRLNAFEGKSFDEIFGKKNIFFFSEINEFILEYWEEGYKNIFNNDREGYCYHYKKINRDRNDAHANDLETNDFEELMRALSWFEKKLDKNNF
jgi:hypothetical protein